MVAPDHAWDALMHDAAEAFIGDVTRPLKRLLADYRAIEDRVEQALANQFGLRRPIDDSVKAADARILRVEQSVVMHNRDGWHDGEDGGLPDGMSIAQLGPSGAMWLFLDRAWAVAPGHVRERHRGRAM